MKRLMFLLLIPALLINTNGTIITKRAENKEINLSEEITNTLTNSFKNALAMETNITFHYNSYLPSLSIFDQFDDNNRTNKIMVDDILLQESYLKKDLSGNAIEEYLTVSNTVEEREVVDSDELAIDFDTQFASPFKSFAKLTNTQINSYFDIFINEEGYYELTANDLGYGFVTNPILSFYTDYDGFIWDNSMTRSISDYTLVINNQGQPLNLSFDKIKKDIFGAIKESYAIDISLIDSVKTLEPVASSLSASQKLNFESQMANFQVLLNEGNFTHNIHIAPEGYEAYEYCNYYALNEDENRELGQVMLCNYPLSEATYGETYVGIVNDIYESTTTLTPLGLSPDSDYYGSTSSTTYSQISEVVPQLSSISSAFFTYDENTELYNFAFDNFAYGDTYFCGTLLLYLFGIADPFVQNLGIYIDNDGYSFDNLSIGFDENGYPFGTLNYYSSGLLISSEFNFSDIGTTDLEEKEEISKVVDFIKNFVL